MPFKPPPYPASLERKNWDANKGLLAKAKGFTGMGQALADLRATYDKVDWDVFDLEKKWGKFSDYAQKGFTVAKLDQDARDATSAVQTGDVSKVRAKALEVRDLATETAADYGKNPLYKKAATLAKDIATNAGHFSVACNVNSLSSEIAGSRDVVYKPVQLTANGLKDLRRLYVEMEKAVVAIVKSPTYDTWLAEKTMDKCRNYNQVVGNGAKIADFGIDIGGSKDEYAQFFRDMNLYARVSCPFESNADKSEIMKHVRALLELVKRAKAFRPLH